MTQRTINRFLLQYPDAEKIVPCDRCGEKCYGYYTLSLLTKALWVLCLKDGHRARPFIENLPIPHKPSEHYLKHTNQKTQDQGEGHPLFTVT